MKKIYTVAAVIAIAVLLASTYFFVANNIFEVQPPKQTLTVFCATSLEFPLAKVETDFEKAYPNIDLQVQGHGTIQVIRHVTELNFKIDVVLVAEVESKDPMTHQKIAEEVRTTITRGSAVSLRYVHLVDTHWLVKTSSGKTARSANREKFLDEMQTRGQKF